MTTKTKPTEGEVLDLINGARVLLNKRIEDAKRQGRPDDELAELDDDLLDMQERIMDEGIAPRTVQS